MTLNRPNLHSYGVQTPSAKNIKNNFHVLKIIDYFVLRTDEDTEEFRASEAVVLPPGVSCFPYRHTGIALEDDAGIHSDDDAFVA